MTNAEPYSIDPAVRAELDREFVRVGKWFKRVQTHAPDPELGSSLAVDDAALNPFQLSHAVVSALSTAVDHMHALRSLIADAHVVYPCATFTLLRAALENAATAVWLLTPPDHRDQRVLRRLRLR